ncbi:MAG: C-terminal binding protein, partial [Chloroflexota bacterium]
MTIKVFQVDPTESLMPFTYEIATIRKHGGELIIGNCNSEADVLAQAQDAEILLLSWKPVLTPRVMDGLPRCRLIVRWGVGYDMIDVGAATARGIAVANTPTYATDAVAEETIALLMNCARRVSWFHEQMRQGGWTNAMTNPIYQIKGRTLGLVGIGRIGSAVAWRARGLGLRVIAHDRYLSDDAIRAQQIEPRSFAEVLAESDYISVHVPLKADTRHLIDAQAFAQMKRGAFFINTSRGPVVDEAALMAALASGQLAGAGLDVFEQEPLPADHPIRQMEHVVLLPHKAAYSEESWFGLRV